MRVLLLKFIPKVGNQGDIVDVSDGYAKNALIAKRLAIVATSAHIHEWEQKKQREINQKQERQKAIQEVLPQLQNHVFEFTVKTGDGGAVFTSVHQDDIKKSLANFLHTQNKLFGIEDVHVKTKPIKELGEHVLAVRIGRGEGVTRATIKIKVVGD